MMADPQNHLRSRIETISVLVRQIAQTKDLPYDAAQFAASAVQQLAQLEMHLNHTRDNTEFVRRVGDRGYQAATLPFPETVNIDAVAPKDGEGKLTFERSEFVKRFPPVGDK